MGSLCGLKEGMIEESRKLGFGVARVTRIEPVSEWASEVTRRIGEGMLSPSDWARRRLGPDPRGAMPEAASCVVLARPYSPYALPFPRGIAGYSAHYREYPRGVEAARRLADWLAGEGLRSLAGPRLPFKALAVRAGVGSYGKNSVIYCREFGSFVTIHVILTDARLELDEPEVLSECGECDACVRACPVGAIAAPGTVDLRKCVRAHMGSGKVVPSELRRAYGNSILGCEACQRSCPRNARVLQDATAPPAGDLEAFSLQGLLSDAGDALRERLDRMAALVGANFARERQVLADAAIAAGNAGDPGLAGALAHALEHPHAPVRAHAAWALGMIGEAGNAAAILRRALAGERDAVVRSEISAALR